jgi:hypothetical protein
MSYWPKKKSGPPDAEAVLKRVSILRNLFVRGIVIPPPSLFAEHLATWTESERIEFNTKVHNQFATRIQQLQKTELWDEMEESERMFMEADALEISEQELIDAGWLAEAAACLLWALEYIPELPPYDKRADTELMKIEFNKRPTMRQLESIKKQRDLAELWHWRARTRQLQETVGPDGGAQVLTVDKILRITSEKAAESGVFLAPIGDDFPAFDKAYRDLSAEEYSHANSIAMERHRAFNWLCGYAPGNRWSQTPTDT